MDITIRKATPEDLELLVETRVEVLLEVNNLSADADMSAVHQASRRYYESEMDKDTFVEYLAFSGAEFAGCGVACFYQVMPTWSNPFGRKGYVMNMYTRPPFRRRGIAKGILTKLVEEAGLRGVPQVHLVATNAGRPLYETFGFTAQEEEMEYRL